MAAHIQKGVTMKPVTLGIIVAAAVIIAFFAGTQIEWTQDGPMEEVGEAIDNATDPAN